MPNRSGHAPGHVRETFLAAADAFIQWEPGEPEPVVDFERNYVAQPIPISQACGMLWNCTDIMPGSEYGRLQQEELPVRRQTYAACARAMRAAISATRAIE
jgi:hypothetical protein